MTYRALSVPRLSVTLLLLLCAWPKLAHPQTAPDKVATDKDGDGYFNRPAPYGALTLTYNGDTLPVQYAEAHYAHEEQTNFAFGDDADTYEPLHYWQGGYEIAFVPQSKPALLARIELKEPLVKGFTTSYLILDFGLLKPNATTEINLLPCFPEQYRDENKILRHRGIRLISE